MRSGNSSSRLTYLGTPTTLSTNNPFGSVYDNSLSRITDSYGQEIRFSYPPGMLVVTMPNRNSLSIEYSPRGRGETYGRAWAHGPKSNTESNAERPSLRELSIQAVWRLKFATQRSNTTQRKGAGHFLLSRDLMHIDSDSGLLETHALLVWLQHSWRHFYGKPMRATY